MAAIPFSELLGKQYGLLTITAEVERIIRNGKRFRVMVCCCACGNQWVGKLQALRSGNTKSCGCSPGRGKCFITHGATVGYSNPPEYSVWKSMKDRCKNPNNKRYRHYGGRGITVCEAWDRDFAVFLSDVGPRPSPQHSIERINNNKGYDPSNVRWDLPRQQTRNRRVNRLVTINGRTLCAADWAELAGIPYKRFLGRIHSGISPERAISREILHTPETRRMWGRIAGIASGVAKRARKNDQQQKGNA